MGIKRLAGGERVNLRNHLRRERDAIGQRLGDETRRVVPGEKADFARNGLLQQLAAPELFVSHFQALRAGENKRHLLAFQQTGEENQNIVRQTAFGNLGFENLVFINQQQNGTIGKMFFQIF
ncbi:MAG: hypothetical protein ONB43_05700 [candidate division KSB1 bacterium]|nr:hypothetical protein [candidate division KSB1 bacterium]MDZ7407379.1 hypothetical protein [candidate division KSB1 bacterium]